MEEKELKGFFRGKKIIITGGLGFIGSNLAIRLLGLEAKVIIVDALTPGHGGNIFNVKGIKNKLQINISDIRNVKLMSGLARGADIIFNLAGQVSHIDSMVAPSRDLEINVASQLSLLESCRKYNPAAKIVFASTRQVYGRPLYLPVDEAHPLKPVDINGVNKAAAESYHTLYNRVYGIRTVCLRMINTYGPRLLIKHNRQGFLGWFVQRIIKGRQIEVFGDGRQLRDLNYVDDVVEALLISGCNESLNGEVFNLGYPSAISLEEIAKLLVKINGSGTYRLLPFPEEKKKIDIGDYYASYEKFKNLTGWSPKIPYEEGLRRTLDYYKVNEKYYC